MPAWEQLGMQAASQGISGALGLVLGNINDRRQLRQQEKLQNLQIKGDKQLTDYNFLKQMELWKNTNYPAQMGMLKAAGLNPALIYQNGGSGASTNISSGSVTAGNAPTGGGEIMQMMAMGLTRDLQLAQIENIKAQTAKTQAETEAVTPGIKKTLVETEKLTTEISSIIQSVKNLEAQEKLTNLQSENLKIQTEYISKDFNQKQESINAQIKHIDQQIENLKSQKKITDIEARYQERILKADLAIKVMDVYLKNAEKLGIEQSIKESIQRISTMVYDNMLKSDRQSNENTGSEKEIYERAMNDNAFPEELKGLLPGIILAPGKGTTGHTPITGFGGKR